MFSDMRFAIRLLIKRPGFSTVAILTLALGIGATTAIFTVVHAILLRPLPFPDADRLAEVRIVGPGGEIYPLPDADFLAWRDQNQTADAIAVWESDPATLTGDGAAERVGSTGVTDRFFDVLGARPLLGRVFNAGDDKPAAPKTVVLSHAFWMRRFHGDPAVVGRPLSLGGVPHTILGVMPASFTFPSETNELWQILTMTPPPRRGPFYTRGIARLKPGVSLEELRANLGVVTAGLKRQYPAPEDWTLDAISLHESLVGNVKQVLWVLLGAVGFLLMIATVNVANLLLARAATREREIALRGALGAARARIVRQLVTESVVLAIVAGGLGLAIASWSTRALLALAPEGIPRLSEVRMNVPVFLFALAAAAICGVVFGLVPALRASRTPLVETLKDGGRGGIGAGHRRVQRVLVVAEIALALVLSAGAGLMIRSLSELQRVSPGFDPGHLLTFQLSLPRAQYPDTPKVRAFYDQLVQRLEALPGVRSAGLSISLPPNLLQVTDNFMVEGQVLPPNQSAPVGPVLMVSDAFFKTLGVPLVRGRVFDERDEDGAPPVVIVNDALAKKYFAGVDPIGRRFKIGGPERPIAPNNPWMTVVGVVGDVKYSGLDAAPEPTYYMPYRQNPWRGQFVAVRGSSDPHALANAVRVVVASLDKDIPVTRVKTMDELMHASVAPPRFRTVLITIFALVGLLLAAIGIYGVMAYAVAERTHELGVRIALGADRGAVLRLVLGETFALAAIGIAVGVAGALAMARLIQSLLFGVTSTDAVTFVGISALLAVTALAASYVPARRAMRVDPMIALRYE
ncbi:MAG TPA: ABC transporter permease [Vicinamibacterales bacterium]|nr:ABC transporter permease [Vicinamibacterales bacterium]